jgi:tetratricopeptide (TPR) repeat protein
MSSDEEPLQRLQRIEEFLAQRPNDPFLLYARTLEFQRLERQEDAAAGFAQLMAEHPDYPATYYAAAKFHQAHGAIAKAKAIFTKGIPVAQKAGEARTVAELREALALLEDDEN